MKLCPCGAWPQLKNTVQILKQEMCLWNTMSPYIGPLTLKDDLDLDLSPLKMCSSIRYTCMPNIKLLSSILQKYTLNEQFWTIHLTFDLEWWPKPWPFTIQNVQLHKIHMHAKYEVAIFNIAKVKKIAY